ncbi:reverse transcriptase domain-containing protein [Tanacetum coccineum]
MSTTRQGMSSTKFEQIVTQRVTNAIDAIAIYKTKICVAYDSIVWVVHQGAKVARNANNKRKWEGGNLHFCNKCKLHHTGPCTVKYGNCKRVGHMTRDCKTLIHATTQRASVAKQKTAVTCYKCGKQGHYRSKYSKWKNQNFGNQKGNKGKAC